MNLGQQTFSLLPKDQRRRIEEWCDQVPVLGFNSGTYDLNLIKKYFTEKLADTTNKVRVAKHGNKIMFILTCGFRFLDIINYLGPGTSYEKWVKAYECKTVRNHGFRTSGLTNLKSWITQDCRITRIGTQS